MSEHRKVAVAKMVVTTLDKVKKNDVFHFVPLGKGDKYPYLNKWLIAKKHGKKIDDSGFCEIYANELVETELK